MSTKVLIFLLREGVYGGFYLVLIPVLQHPSFFEQSLPETGPAVVGSRQSTSIGNGEHVGQQIAAGCFFLYVCIWIPVYHNVPQIVKLTRPLVCTFQLNMFSGNCNQG